MGKKKIVCRSKVQFAKLIGRKLLVLVVVIIAVDVLEKFGIMVKIGKSGEFLLAAITDHLWSSE